MMGGEWYWRGEVNEPLLYGILDAPGDPLAKLAFIRMDLKLEKYDASQPKE
jgi:hypothetical protein